MLILEATPFELKQSGHPEWAVQPCGREDLRFREYYCFQNSSLKPWRQQQLDSLQQRARDDAAACLWSVWTRSCPRVVSRGVGAYKHPIAHSLREGGFQMVAGETWS